MCNISSILCCNWYGSGTSGSLENAQEWNLVTTLFSILNQIHANEVAPWIPTNYKQSTMVSPKFSIYQIELFYSTHGWKLERFCGVIFKIYILIIGKKQQIEIRSETQETVLILQTEKKNVEIILWDCKSKRNLSMLQFSFFENFHALS